MTVTFLGEGDVENEITVVTVSVDQNKLSVTFTDDGETETEVYTKQ